MKKADIEVRGRSWNSYGTPALNVKCYTFPGIEDVQEAFLCDEDTAQQALNFAFETGQQSFWEDAIEQAREIFGNHVRVFVAGRSGGWLTVEGLPDLDSWDAIMLGKWAKLARWVRVEMKWLSSWEKVQEDIDANRWAEPHAEKYNFVTRADGENICLADVNKAKAEAAKEVEKRFGL